MTMLQARQDMAGIRRPCSCGLTGNVACGALRTMGFWSLRKIVNSSMGLAMLLGALASFAPFYLATRTVKQFCATLTTGMSLADVLSRSTAKGYELLRDPDGRLRVHDPASFGRRNCRLTFDDKGLTSSTFSDGD